MAATNVSQSLSTRPYFLSAIDQLPESLLELARSHLPGNQVIEGIFVVPPETYKHGSSWSLNPLQAIIFTQQGVLHLAAFSKREQPGETVWISADDIFLIKLSLILLYGKLEIYGVQNEQATKIEVEYNTVAHNLLAPVLRGLIRKTWQKNPSTNKNRRQDASFSSLYFDSFSFYNGLTDEAIQPDELVLGYVYQPEIREPWLRIFHKELFPQIVLALTDQQLILLQQDLKLKEHHEWIFTFVPLYRLGRLEQSVMKEWQKISICLLPESMQNSVEIIFESENAQKWCTIWDEVLGIMN